MHLSPDDDDTLRTKVLPTQQAVHVRDWGARSDIGLVRENNEDAWGERDGTRFAVADGMGGADGGERASSIAVAGFLSADPAHGWLSAVNDINVAVRQGCDADGLESAGTTLVGVVLDRQRLVSISVGDSRIYRLRDRELEQLTSDHNLGNLRAEEGLAPESDDGRGRASALTAYLGNPVPGQRVDVGTASAESGDRLLLCSDGVHGQLPAERVAALLGAGTAEDAAETLVAAANAAGGRDNATALVIDIGGDDT